MLIRRQIGTHLAGVVRLLLLFAPLARCLDTGIPIFRNIAFAFFTRLVRIYSAALRTAPARTFSVFRSAASFGVHHADISTGRRQLGLPTNLKFEGQRNQK